MRINWLFMAAAIAVGLFGVELLVAPGWLLSFNGMAATPDGEVVARLLGAQLLGYVPLEWLAVRGSREVRLVNLRSVFVAELVSLLVVVVAAAQGRGNAMFFGLVAVFLVFTLWRGYYLVTYRPA